MKHFLICVWTVDFSVESLLKSVIVPMMMTYHAGKNDTHRNVIVVD